MPLSPVVQHTAESVGKPIELRVYTGADGNFVFYDDAGDSYAYEKGEYEEIPLAWTEANSTLVIGKRRGKGYLGMSLKRKFEVVIINASGSARREVIYDGTSISLTGFTHLKK